MVVKNTADSFQMTQTIGNFWVYNVFAIQHSNGWTCNYQVLCHIVEQYRNWDCYFVRQVTKSLWKELSCNRIMQSTFVTISLLGCNFAAKRPRLLRFYQHKANKFLFHFFVQLNCKFSHCGQKILWWVYLDL